MTIECLNPAMHLTTDVDEHGGGFGGTMGHGSPEANFVILGRSEVEHVAEPVDRILGCGPSAFNHGFRGRRAESIGVSGSGVKCLRY